MQAFTITQTDKHIQVDKFIPHILEQNMQRQAHKQLVNDRECNLTSLHKSLHALIHYKPTAAMFGFTGTLTSSSIWGHLLAATLI